MAEHSALLKCAGCITNLLQHQVLSISSKLLEKGLTTKDDHDWVLTAKGVSDREKAARLVSGVIDYVKSCPEKYSVFVGILKEEPFFKETIENLSFEYHSHVSPKPDDVLSWIKELDLKFRSLHQGLLSELESKKVPVRKVVNSLTLLPIDLRQEYEKAISSKLPDLRREEEAGDLFRYHLNPLVNFLDYGLIKYVIDQFGSNTLKGMMKSYSDDALVFMKKTTVKQLMDVWPGQQEIPPNFSKLRAKIDKDPSTYTLYQLDQLRRRFCSAVKLTEFVSVLIGLHTANSFIVEWLIPSTLVPQLMESASQLDFGFYLRECILKMTVDEKHIFPMLPDAKPKVPALQAAATTVTDLPESQDTKLTSERAVTPSLFLQLVRQGIMNELRLYTPYSGVGVIYDIMFLHACIWESMKHHLPVLNYNIITDFHLQRTTLFTTIAQSIHVAYPKPSAAAESSDSPPFVVAVFVSGVVGDSANTLFTVHGSLDIVEYVIKPFLPQSAPHLQHIPKLFFISAWGDPYAPPPHFPDDPDGNYCVAYHVTNMPSDMNNHWADHITDHLFLPGMTVQEVIESSRLHLHQVHYREQLHHFTCLKNKLVLKK